MIGNIDLVEKFIKRKEYSIHFLKIPHQVVIYVNFLKQWGRGLLPKKVGRIWCISPELSTVPKEIYDVEMNQTQEDIKEHIRRMFKHYKHYHFGEIKIRGKKRLVAFTPFSKGSKLT